MLNEGFSLKLCWLRIRITHDGMGNLNNSLVLLWLWCCPWRFFLTKHRILQGSHVTLVFIWIEGVFGEDIILQEKFGHKATGGEAEFRLLR